MKRIIALILVMVLCISMIPNLCVAKNVCDFIMGNSESTRRFKVTTKDYFWIFSNEKITLSQEMGTYEYYPFSSTWEKKQESGYMMYHVRYRKQGSSTWTEKEWKGKSITISLSKYSTYEIEVIPFTQTELNRAFSVRGKSGIEFKRIMTWTVSKTKGVNYCN